MRLERRLAARSGSTLLGCVACLLAVGCSQESTGPSVRYDLIASLPAARSSCDGFDLELGGDGEARRRLVSGWSWTERSGERQFAWSIGDRSTVEFPLLFPRALRFEATALAWSDPAIDRRQEVSVTVNGEPVGRLRFESPGEFEQLEMTVPGTALVRGLNRLELTYAFTRSQVVDHGRGRDLAVAWSALRLSDLSTDEQTSCRRSPTVTRGESGSLRLQPFEVLEWKVELRAGERLVLMEVDRPPDDELVVGLSADAEAMELLGVAASDGSDESGELELALLPGAEPDAGFAPYRLLIASRAGARMGQAWIVDGPTERETDPSEGRRRSSQ